MPRKHNLNICRSGETSSQYTVTTADNNGVGSYTCSVTVSTIVSTDSTAYMVTATGLFFDMICKSIYIDNLNMVHYVVEYLKYYP